MPSGQDDVRTAMKVAVDTFIEAPSKALERRDVSLFSSKLASTCTRHLKPSTFPDAFPEMVRAVETNTEYESRMALQIASLEEMRYNVLDYVIDHVQCKASVRVEQFIKPFGNDDSTMEIVWNLDFTDDGTEITRVIEFIDTALPTKVLQ
ncbi:hypothetical protein F4677DRAFT_417335 [Hypoxylon crocopeplum]|nr:hypothetical protein F4677DRAFT_417335 [Hypoxylon crocopeplum]